MIISLLILSNILMALFCFMQERIIISQQKENEKVINYAELLAKELVAVNKMYHKQVIEKQKHEQ